MWKRLTGLLALLLASSVPAGAVTVEAVATDYDFTTDGMLDVELRVGDAGGLTGLEVSIGHGDRRPPADRVVPTSLQ